jgi:hypothetical protein
MRQDFLDEVRGSRLVVTEKYPQVPGPMQNAKHLDGIKDGAVKKEVVVDDGIAQVWRYCSTTSIMGSPALINATST